MSDKKIILIKDLLDAKERHEKELAYYMERIDFLKQRMAVIKHDIEVTKTVIKLIKEEKIIEIDKL